MSSDKAMERARKWLGERLTGSGPDRRGGRVVLSGEYLAAMESLAAEFDAVAREAFAVAARMAQESYDYGDEQAAQNLSAAIAAMGSPVGQAVVLEKAERRAFERTREAAVEVCADYRVALDKTGQHHAGTVADQCSIRIGKLAFEQIGGSDAAS